MGINFNAGGDVKAGGNITIAGRDMQMTKKEEQITKTILQRASESDDPSTAQAAGVLLEKLFGLIPGMK